MNCRVILVIYLALIGVVLAVPVAPNPSKYELLKRNSPFTEKPVTVREKKAPEPGLEKDWFIASVAKTIYGEEVVIAKKSQRSKRMRFGGMHGAGPSGYKLQSVTRGKTYREDKVVIAHGGRTSTLTYDAKVAKSKAAPQPRTTKPKKTVKKPNQAAQQGTVPPIPGLNTSNTGKSGAKQRKPRVRYVPPAKPKK